MNFTYELVGRGWADSVLKLDGKTLCFSVSYLSDALNDLLNQLLYLAPESLNDNEIVVNREIFWHAEPGGAYWVLERINNFEIRVKIESVTDVTNLDSSRNTEINTICNYDEFLETIIMAMDIIIKKYGFVGYRESWVNFDFPIYPYLKLKHYLLKKEKYPLEEKAEDGYKEFFKSNLQHEMSLLNKTSC